MKVFGYRAAAIFLMWLAGTVLFTLIGWGAGAPTFLEAVQYAAVVVTGVAALIGICVGFYKAVNWLWEAADDARYARQRGWK